MEAIGNKGLIILEKADTNIKLMTCAGYFVENGVEEQIKTIDQRRSSTLGMQAVRLCSKLRERHDF